LKFLVANEVNIGFCPDKAQPLTRIVITEHKFLLCIAGTKSRRNRALGSEWIEGNRRPGKEGYSARPIERREADRI
jgi:hypothetical protein